MRHLIFAAALFATALPASVSGAEDSDLELFSQINDAINNISQETARESHAACMEISKKVAARSGMSPLMRLYFESQVESCIAYAMNNGDYSDESGDQCSHQFAHATKLSQLIEQAGSHEVYASQLPQYQDMLQSAVRLGEGMKCTQDFAAFKG